MIYFPVNAAVRSDADDIPKPEIPTLKIGIFDAHGYWVTLGQGIVELPGDMLDLGNQIAKMINAAYEQGRKDHAACIRDLLDYGVEP